ncbi:Mitotic spindle assembly checkpoint protein MAD1, partial [Dissostichus eleginoides]
MDLEDDTSVLTTLKSFNSFISHTEAPQRLSEGSAGSGNLQSQYKRSMELLEAGERVHSNNRYLQLDEEKKQMELSHKRARYELEKVASDSARDLEHEVDRNQDLLGRLKKFQERETEAAKNLSEQVEANRALRKNMEGLNRKLEERDTRLNTANQTISSLKDDIRELTQRIQNQDSTTSSQTLENQELQEQKHQEVSQLCQSLQAAQSSCSEHIVKIKELERRLALQEQDIAIVKTVKSEVAKVPNLEKDLKRLREDNAFLRKPEDLSREVIHIQQREIALKEQNYTLSSRVRSAERSQNEHRAELCQQRSKTLEEQKKRETQDSLVRRLQKRVLLLTKERDGMRAILESYDSELAPTEYSPQLNKRLREAEDILQKTQSHNVEMEAQLTKSQEETGTLKLQLQTVELELESLKKHQASAADSNTSGTKEELNILRQKIEDLESERQRLEEQNNILEMRLERHILQEDQLLLTRGLEPLGCTPTALQNNMFSSQDLRKRLFIKISVLQIAGHQKEKSLRYNLHLDSSMVPFIALGTEGDYDPIKTRVLHFKMNPTTVAKQQRQQDIDALREEVTRLSELVRSLQEGGAMVQGDSSINASLSLPPSKEVVDLRKQMESLELRNQRLKEVFQRKIQEFRTVCYVLTGYQIDITTENQYRLTSVYAEQMDDSLLFKKEEIESQGQLIKTYSQLTVNLLTTERWRERKECMEEG